MMMSGSARKNAFITEAKSSPAFLLTWTCRSPFCVISTGSSAVHILVSGVLRNFSIECSVVVFPEPVGPHTKNRPYGLLTASFSFGKLEGDTPSLSNGIGSPAARIRITISSTPPAEGIVATRSSISNGPNFLNFIFPSWGFRFSDMSKSHMIFSRATRAFR